MLYQRLSGFLRGVERVGGFGGKSDLLASNQIYLGSPDAYKASLKRIEGATPEDLRSAGRRWLSDGVYVLEVNPYPKYETSKAGADRSKAPELAAFPELRLPKLQHSTLANGMKVVLAERHETPLVNLWLVLDAGYAADQSALPGTAQATAAQLTGGTKSRTALEISDEQAVLGAQLGAYSNLDVSVVRLSALKAKLDPSLALYADVILNPAFPQEDFARQQKLQLAAIQREKVTGVAMGLRVLPALLYGKGHSYGNSLTGSGTEESVAKLTRQDLIKFHQTWFRPNNGTLVVVGDTTMAEITPKLEKLFAGWPKRDVPAKKITFRWPLGAFCQSVNSPELSTPRKTRQTRQFAFNSLITLIKGVSGSPRNPTTNPTNCRRKLDKSAARPGCCPVARARRIRRVRSRYHLSSAGPWNSCRFPPVLFTGSIGPWHASIESVPTTLRAGHVLGPVDVTRTYQG